VIAPGGSDEDGRRPRAAIVTGGSSGIGLAIARMLGGTGFGLTLAARRAEKLRTAAEELRSVGVAVETVAGDLREEETIRHVVRTHKERYGRLDVLVNNAGVGAAGPIQDLATKHLDLMLAANLRSTILFYRETVDLLRAAGAEHGRALVINTASITGVTAHSPLAVYGATKAAVINFSKAMNDELAGDGVKSTALCPAFVDTAMTEFVRESVGRENMITPEDIAVAVEALLRMSPNCIVPELQFLRPSDRV
jgi:short-subunit dehydrogenase